jgi:chromosome segregation ATPase
MSAQLSKTESAVYSITDIPRMDIAIQTLAQRSMFWRPVYLAQSAWLEHIPFAFWLTEAHRPRVLVELGVHYGASYFAFCQAVDRLGLDTRCFGVDTFKGDEHAGAYDERVFEQVRAHNDAQYSGFSRLVRSTFDDALKHFADGSIDLLHIDGLHTLEAVRHDFDCWLPKLSDRAIVVMHDTNVRERNFGVFKLFETLKQEYPHFEFVHGHGLGVLGVGKDQNELMQMLFQASDNQHGRQAVHEVFSRLGQACATAFSTTNQRDHAKLLNATIEKQKKQIDETHQSLEKAKAEIASHEKELALVKETIKNQFQQHATERDHFVEKAKLLQELRTELKEETARMHVRLESMSSELQLKSRELAAMTRERNETCRQVDSVTAQLAESECAIAELNEKINIRIALEQQHSDAVKKLSSEKMVLAEDLAKRDDMLADFRQTIEEARIDNMHLNERLDIREAELEKVNSTFLQAAAELEKIRAENERQADEIATLNLSLSASAAAFEAQSETLATHSTEVADLAKIIESQAGEQRGMQIQIDQMKAIGEELAQENKALIEDKNRYAAALEDKIEKLADLRKMIEERDARLQAANNEVTLHQQRANKLDDECKEQADALTEAKKRLIEMETQAAADRTKKDALFAQLQAEQQKSKREQQAQEKRLEDRFKEIAELTKIIDERDNGLKTKDKEVAAQQQRANKLDGELQAKTEALKASEKQLAEAKAKVAAVQKQKDATTAQLQAEQQNLKNELQAKTEALKAGEKQLAEAKAKAAASQTQKDAAMSQLEAEQKKLKNELQAKADAIKASEKQLAEAKAQAAESHAKKDAALAQLQAEQQKLKAEQQAQAKRLEDRFKELAALTKLLEERDRALLAKEEELQAEKRRFLHPEHTQLTPPSSTQKAGKTRPDALKNAKEVLSVRAQILLIEKSGLFHKSWYLDQYPDVAESKMHPIQHYVLHGASEGRMPGPNFDTNRYVESHPDVLNTQLNPLVHYIRNEMNEGHPLVHAEHAAHGLNQENRS